MNHSSDQHPTAKNSAVSRPGGSLIHRAASIVMRPLRPADNDSANQDAQLLERYCTSRCPEAFQMLVQRHVGWVQSVVRRHIKDRHLAEDVIQAVFIILARKAHTIPRGSLLSPWLFRVARFAANDAIKQESRRRKRMERVAELQTSAQQKGVDQATISAIEPELDDALASLSESDRQAILLRFYEDKSMAEVGIALGISEDAAKQRVSRALKRMRATLQRKGLQVASVAAILALLHQSAQQAQAAIAIKGVAIAEFAKVATGQTEAAGRSLQTVQATLKTIASAKVRLWAAVAGSAFTLGLAVTVLSPALGDIVQPLFDSVQTSLVWSHSSTGASATPAESADDQPSKEAVVHLWVGDSNERAWPILPRSAPVTPLPLRTITGADEAVAVAEDVRGMLWYRKIDQQVLNHLAENDPRYKDYDELNPYRSILPTAAVTDLLPPDAFRGARTASADGVEWQPVETPHPGGVVVLPFSPLNPGTNGDLNSPIPSQLAPEPTFLSISIAAAALLIRRRR